MEGAPKIPVPEAANLNEASSPERELTPEVLAESVERASELVEALKQLDKTDKNDNVIALNKQEWQKAGELSAELKETLRYIPATQCFENGLPFHPDDAKTKYEYPRAEMPEEAPDWYKEAVGYDPKPGDGARVDQEQVA